MKQKTLITVKIFVIFCILTFMFFLFLSMVISKLFTSNQTLSLVTSKTDIAVRGDIYSSDNFTLASSQKLYKISVNTYSIDPDKLELFTNLLSIYSGIDASEIAKKLTQKGYVTLSYSITPSIAKELRQLNSKFIAYDVFQEYKDKNGRIYQKMGLSVEVSGISRVYPYGDILEPVLGYVQKREIGTITTPNGVKGIEKYKNLELQPKQDGLIKGKRDIGFNIIYDGYTSEKSRLDGQNIYLTINLRLQKKIEETLDNFNRQYETQEIIAGIMNAKDGSILALASTNRFDPKNIQDTKNLDASVSEKSFEPGSTIKPIIFSLLLDKNLINPLEPIDLSKGYYQIGKYTIKDDTLPSKNSVVQDVLIRSSNVGMVKISKKLSGQEFYDGLKSFGISKATGIELPYEKVGVIPSAEKLSREIFKATASYGYGLSTTFLQLLQAYGVFVNDGALINPHITYDGKDSFKNHARQQVISPTTARKVEEILIKTVEEGTGKRARIKGLLIGGKTGTARIVKKTGGYDNLYNGSFFGFVKDEEQTYVIGVVAFGSHGKEDYYGSQTAAPIFKSIVEEMQEHSLLSKPSKSQN